MFRLCSWRLRQELLCLGAPAMLFYSFILLLYVILPVLLNFLPWAVFRWAGISVHEVRIFAGKAIKTFTLGETTLIIGCIPTHCSIAYDIGEFSGRGLPFRLGVTLMGAASFLTIASVLLGWESTWHYCWTGFSQLWQGALHPQTEAPRLIGRLQEVFSHSWSETAGILATKWMAFTLLPLGGWTTIQVVRQILDPFDKWKAMHYFCGTSGTVSFLLYYWWIVIVILVASGLMPSA